MNYQLIRSKRKTLSLQINNNAELVVRAPNRLSVKKIEQFIEEKSDWIEKKSKSIKVKEVKKPNYEEGEEFHYLGNLYPFTIQSSKNLSFNGISFSAEQIDKDKLLKWYKTAFKSIAIPRLDYYADTFLLPYKQVRLKAQKTLWGSCSHTNNINLNYLLIRAPMDIIDYVIVHELAHTKIKNHSKDFWQLVESILPEYKASKSWLKDNGYKLHNL
jgi:predicted metal-dependent hydrolase